MKYVYILQSKSGNHFYTGITDDLEARLAKHNAGAVTHTSNFRPWRIKSYIAFTDEPRARAFEICLKSASGRAFAKARLQSHPSPSTALLLHSHREGILEWSSIAHKLHCEPRKIGQNCIRPSFVSYDRRSSTR
jgi:predicted GIY-YIG superfamily endonuclease